ncbi:LysR family transcriptional regulator [Bowmanella sp. Y26]|uniref:LysR family transcriptional regulator n=1 Tax=Bowmanella yangjiangensis TaxID=2811230 RepID=UPI001BDD5FA0|nr:LysR family transcriptional regulator [Bowmanella yangjiangensis]MBT1065416.1 LysR family transcriptional regulator [Bowmanella yangjiangensis]
MINSRKLRQVSNLDLKLLKTFIAVVQAGSFTGAESLLNLSRSAISIYISDLEKRLGMKLCNRGRAGFSLTLEGQKVYEAAQKLMYATDVFQEEVNNTYAVLKGELNIGIIDNLVTIPHRTISNALAKLKHISSEIRINIRMSNPADISLALLEGELDVGVMPSLQPIDGLRLHPLYSETSALYCSNAHPLFSSPDDLQTIGQHSAVLPIYAEQMNQPQLFDQLNVTATSNDREGVAFLILTHEYIGFLPEHYATRWVEKGEMRALLPDMLKYQTDFYVVTRQSQRNKRVLDVFLNALVDKQVIAD